MRDKEGVMAGTTVGTVSEWMRDVLETGVRVLHRRRREMWWGGSLTVPAVEAPRPARPQDVPWRFSGPDGTVYGIGQAARFAFERGAVLEAMAAAARAMRRERDLPPGARLGGGIAFQPRTPGGVWRGFPAGMLVLPVLTVEAGPEGTVTVHLAALLKPEMPLRRFYQIVARTDGACPPRVSGAELVETRFRSAPGRFLDLVRETLRALDQGRFEKVVLARSMELQLRASPDPDHLFRALGREADGALRFLVRSQDAAFLGASPELLARVQDGRVESVSLAGTAERGSDPGLLLRNPKERTEHEWVRRFLADGLAEVADGVAIPDEPVVRSSGPVQHLYTPASGHLKPDRDIWDVLRALHPTPAVGGVPREAALRWIRDHEGFDRGWYAGAVGTVNLRGEGAFYVALRSGLVRGSRVVLFAGGGVVPGSDPERE